MIFTRLLLPFVAATLLTPLGGRPHRLTEDGNRAYEQGRYEEALRAYTEAQVDAPDSPELHYDIGNVLYRQGDYGGAAEAFRRALLAAPPELESAAAYNLGNALYRDERFGEAVEAYRRSLRADPEDVDAKRNLELAMRAARQTPPPPSPQSRPSGSPEGDGQSPAPGSSEAPTPPGEEPPSPSRESEQPAEPSSSRPGDGAPTGEMSEEEAERLLDSLNDREKEALRREAARRARRAEAAGVEKDW